MKCKKCGTYNAENCNFCTSCGEKLDKVIICDNCQYENETTAGYCKSCGQKLNDSVVPENTNTPGIRKAMKKAAKEKKKSSIILTYLSMFGLGILLFVVFILLLFATKLNPFVVFISVVVFVAFIVFNYVVKFGTTVASLELARGNEVSLGNVMTCGFGNVMGVVRVFLLGILFGIGLSVVGAVPIIGFILYIVAMVYVTPIVTVFGLLQADKSQGDIEFIDCIKRSYYLCKGKKIEYYGLIISFIGWILLGIVTLGIAFLWVIPYIKISLANYYRMLLKEENFNSEESGISNIAIIIIGVLTSIVIFIIVSVFAFALLIFSKVDPNSETFEDDLQAVIDEYTQEQDSDTQDVVGDLIQEIKNA